MASWPISRVVDALQKLAHDLIARSYGAPARYFGDDALAAALRDPAPDVARLADWSRELVQAARHDEHPWHATLRIEALVARAASLWQTPREELVSSSGPLDTLRTR
jgi:DNA polymerase-3 subunit delta'